MTSEFRLVAAISAILLMVPTYSFGLPQSADTVKKIKEEKARISLEFHSKHWGSQRLQFLKQEFGQAHDRDVGLHILTLAEQLDDPGREAFLISVLRNSKLPLQRILAAEILGRVGTTAAIEPLKKCAATDPTQTCVVGCFGFPRNARSAAFNALADIGRRNKTETVRVTDAIRNIPADSHELRDVQIRSLRVVTDDEAELLPFFDRLASWDPAVRLSGVEAFSSRHLEQAPAMLVNLLDDPDPEVRSGVATALGFIKDPTTIDILMNVASNSRRDLQTRCCAISALGRMKAIRARPLLLRLSRPGNLQDIHITAAHALAELGGLSEQDVAFRLLHDR